MRARLTYSAIFLAFILAVAVAQWPASWFEGRMAGLSGGRWDIASASGTIWDGSATVLLNDSGGNPGAGGKARWRPVQNVRWNVRWNEFWRGRLVIESALEQGKTLIVLNGADVSLEKLDAQLPASMLAAIPGPVGRYGWMGQLQARSPAFRCSHQLHCSGEVEILWKDAGVAEIPGPTLGTYRLRLVGEGASVHFDLATLAGRLRVVGNGEFAAGGLRFTGEASAEGGDASLEAKLRTLGRPGAAPGRYVIDYRE